MPTPRARVTGPAFLMGWLLGLAVVCTVVLLLAEPAHANSGVESASRVKILKLVVGVALILLATRRWPSRPTDDQEPDTPESMGAIDSFMPLTAVCAGVFLGGMKPKNLVLAIGAAASIAEMGISGGRRRGLRAHREHRGCVPPRSSTSRAATGPVRFSTK